MHISALSFSFQLNHTDRESKTFKMTIKQDKKHIHDSDTFGQAEQILKEIPHDCTDDPGGGDSGCYDSSDVGGQRGVPFSHPDPRNFVPNLRLGTNRPGSEKLIFNVGGKHFMTYRSTLERIPHTRISDLDELDPAYDFQNDEYFFDRNPKFFSAVLDYFRTGELHFQHCLCGPSIKRELDFWGISDFYIANCCWRAYKGYEEEEETMEILENTLDDGSTKPSKYHYCDKTDGTHTTYCKRRKKFWDFLDAPTSSAYAMAWAVFLFFIILTSIALVCLQTHPFFRVTRPNLNQTAIDALNLTNPKKMMFRTTNPHFVIYYLDYTCIIFFTTEIVLRFFGCPSKIEYWKSIFNIFDIFCVLPMIVITAIDLKDPNFWDDKDFLIVLCYLSVTSVLRVFRLLKLGKHYKGLKILLLAVRSSLRELLLLFLLIFMGMLVFSTLIYFAEFETPGNEFANIPIGFWWSIITMTTVGYGDMFPSSAVGYIFGGACAIAGMLATGLPIPIIASNFNHYYAYARYRTKLSARKQHTKPTENCNGNGEALGAVQDGSPPVTASKIVVRHVNKVNPEKSTSSV